MQNIFLAGDVKMIKRFSLYGFLKNLRFFEPFFLLFLREKGLSYLEIGFLFSFREICINVMEVPSGALADLYGKKSVMLFSLISYAVSFVIFGMANTTWILYFAMFFFSIGEAFRTGTHKSMIFEWLRDQNMMHKKTEIYGYTRSWAQKGSALSVLLASALVFYTGSYKYVFWFSILPYLLGIWNMACYPSWMNKSVEHGVNIKAIFAHLWKSTLSLFKGTDCRPGGLILKSMVYSGNFKAIKDYLQALIKVQVLAIPLWLSLSDDKRTAVLIGIVYFVLYLLTSTASKNAFRIANLFKGNERANTAIMAITALILFISGVFAYFKIYFVPILGFIAFFNLQNVFRPILLSQFDDCTQSDQQATVLSIESQAASVGVLTIAPLAGYFADRFGLYAVFVACSFILGTFVLISSRFSKPPYPPQTSPKS